MQDRNNRPDYSTVGDPSFSSTLTSAGVPGRSISALEPYTPPNVPHGLPHVVRFATLSSMDLPLEVRFLIIMLARFANVDGVTTIAVSTLCEICRIGSKNTVERWIGLAADMGILRKEPGKGGKDRKSNSYTFLGTARDWAPLPVGRPDTNPIIALAQARRLIEELQPKAARVDDLEAELVLLRAEVALLRNGSPNGHSEVINGEGQPLSAPPSGGYETAVPDVSRESHGAIGHFQVPNGPPESSSEEASHSYETPDSGSSQVSHGAIGHFRVPNGSAETPPGENPRSHEALVSEPSSATQEPIAHSELSNGSDEGQEYLARRDRVESLVMRHRAYYDRSFHRRGVLGAIEYFSRSAENERELVRQVGILDAGQDPGRTSNEARQQTEGPTPPVNPETGRSEVEYCPDCGSPYTTFNGEERCPDCTGRRRRESEA